MSTDEPDNANLLHSHVPRPLRPRIAAGPGTALAPTPADTTMPSSAYQP